MPIILTWAGARATDIPIAMPIAAKPPDAAYQRCFSVSQSLKSALK
jgi:hypothetical protein